MALILIWGGSNELWTSGLWHRDKLCEDCHLVLQLLLLSWSYFMVLLEDPGPVPENWILTSEAENMEAGSSSLPEHDPTEASTYSTLDGAGRRHTAYCRQCQNGKPPRCHHCSVCKLLSFNTIPASLYFFTQSHGNDFVPNELSVFWFVLLFPIH